MAHPSAIARGRLRLAAIERYGEARGRGMIVEQARRWLGTPYHHEGDVMGMGVDCGMILVRVFVDLGFVEPFDPRPYNMDFMLHHDEERYLGIIQACGAIEIHREPGPGDIAIWRHGRLYSHGAIVTKWPHIIHAFAPCRSVVADDASTRATLTTARHGPVRFFSLWP